MNKPPICVAAQIKHAAHVTLEVDGRNPGHIDTNPATTETGRARAYVPRFFC